MIQGPGQLRSLHNTRLNLAVRDVSDLPLLFQNLVTVEDRSDDCALYKRARTFWLFLHQVLTPGMSCQETVHKALIWFYMEEARRVSSNTGAYCQARARLCLNWLMDLARAVAQTLENKADRFELSGRRIFLVDGSSLSMPDTPANQLRWPQPVGQKPGLGFPSLRLMAVFSISTGALVRLVWTPLECGESTLWRMLWSSFRRGDIIVGDRGFCAVGNMMLLLKRGIDCIVRQHACRGAGITEIKRLGKEDRLVHWSRDKHTPRWLEWQWRSELPKIMLVREITFTLDIAGWRSKHITVATTLLNPQLYPREVIMQIYYRRWHAELRLRDVKNTMAMDVLHCKSPDMIEREIAMYWIGYNLVRGLIAEAAVRSQRDPLSLSFKSCITLIRQWAPYCPTSGGNTALIEFYDLLLAYMGEQVLRSKPGRTQPRAVKRRPKTFARLNKPRHLFKDIPHRNHYKKTDTSASQAVA